MSETPEPQNMAAPDPRTELADKLAKAEKKAAKTKRKIARAKARRNPFPKKNVAARKKNQTKEEK